MKKQRVGSVQEKTQGDLMKDRLKSVPKGYLCPTFFSFPFLMSINEKPLMFFSFTLSDPESNKNKNSRKKMGWVDGVWDLLAHCSNSTLLLMWMLSILMCPLVGCSKNPSNTTWTTKTKITVCGTTALCAKTIYCTRWCNFKIKA